MWYWLRKNTHEPYVQWRYLIGLSFFFHLVVLLLLFFAYRDTVSHLSFTIGRKYIRRDIEFRIAIETVKRPSKSAMMPLSPKKAKPLQKQATVAQVPSKKEQPKKQSVPKEKKAAPPKEIPVPVAPPIAAPAPEEHLAMDITANKIDDHMTGEYELLYDAIVSCWSPPPGIPVDVTCTITISLDRQGLITTKEMNNPSGMLMYDLAAQAAINEIHFPRLAWGKSITITFSV